MSEGKFGMRLGGSTATAHLGEDYGPDTGLDRRRLVGNAQDRGTFAAPGGPRVKQSFGGGQRRRSAGGSGEGISRSDSLRHQHAGDGRPGVREEAGHHGKRQGNSGGDDYDRGQRESRHTGALGGRQGIYPETIYSGAGERARSAGGGETIMSTDTSLIVRSKEENWLPVLELATEEVFEIMVGTRVKPLPKGEGTPPGGYTAMVGIAGGLCGILTVTCDKKTAGEIAKAMLGPDIADSEEQIS